MWEGISLQTISDGKDIAWCDSCLNIVGSTVFNEDEIYQIPHEFCPNCVRAIIKRYDRLRKTSDELKPMPNEVKERVYNILRTNIGSLCEWKVCEHCGRLWKDDVRITIPRGKCKGCLKTPNIITVFEWYRLCTQNSP